jgi:hypothetical protein
LFLLFQVCGHYDYFISENGKGQAFHMNETSSDIRWVDMMWRAQLGHPRFPEQYCQCIWSIEASSSDISNCWVDTQVSKLTYYKLQDIYRSFRFDHRGIEFAIKSEDMDSWMTKCSDHARTKVETCTLRLYMLKRICIVHLIT